MKWNGVLDQIRDQWFLNVAEFSIYMNVYINIQLVPHEIYQFNHTKPSFQILESIRRRKLIGWRIKRKHVPTFCAEIQLNWCSCGFRSCFYILGIITAVALATSNKPYWFDSDYWIICYESSSNILYMKMYSRKIMEIIREFCPKKQANKNNYSEAI